MAKVSFKHYTAGALALAVAVFVGCMGNEAQGPSSDDVGSLSVNVSTGSAAKASLSKGSTITLSKLVITFISNASTPDTVRDTITVGEHGFSATSTAQQTIDSVYTLKALRTWIITAKTLDTKDSVVHTKTDTIVKLLAGETREVDLTLVPRFVMYKANFSFPDSIGTSAGTGIKQGLNVKRLVMIVNGDTVVDSSATFAPSTAYTIGYDYVPVNAGTTVQLSVIGRLSGWSYAGDSVLYRKNDITVSGQSPTADSTKLVTLPYVGPVTGKADLSVTIQKVGLYQVTAVTDSTVIPKKASK